MTEESPPSQTPDTDYLRRLTSELPPGKALKLFILKCEEFEREREDLDRRCIAAQRHLGELEQQLAAVRDAIRTSDGEGDEGLITLSLPRDIARKLLDND